MKIIDRLLDSADDDFIKEIVDIADETISDKDGYKEFALAIVKKDPVSLSHIEADSLPDGEYFSLALCAIREHNRAVGSDYNPDRYTIECVDVEHVTPDQYLRLALEAGPAQNTLNVVDIDMLPEGGYLKLALSCVEKDGFQLFQIGWVKSSELTSEEYLSFVLKAGEKLGGTKKVLGCLRELQLHDFSFDGKKGGEAIQALQEKLIQVGPKVVSPEEQGTLGKNDIEAWIGEYRG